MKFKRNDDFGRKEIIVLLKIISVSFLIAGFFVGITSNNDVNVLEGLKNIVLSPTILITDFIQVGGVGAALINVGIVALINVFILEHYQLKINGVILAAFFTVLGFSFFGKNLFNIIPIYIGGILYTRYQKISFKEIIVVIMFGTALSPIISEISFAEIIPPYYSIIVAEIVGVFIGFVIVPLSSHMLRFHDGYNLYNIGFTSGIIGTVLTSLLRSFGIEVTPVYIVSESNHAIIIYLLILLFVALIILGYIVNGNSFKGLLTTTRYSGRLITDFTHLTGYGVSFMNMGLLGVLSLGYVMIIGGIVNGPVIAGILTVAGFGAFGKHLKNILPVMIGVIVTALFFGYELNSTSIIISVLFSTTLAPIAGVYGPIVGFIAGVLHMILVTNVGVIHGGINLYNNGFSGGLVAGVLIPVVDAFERK